MKNRLKYIVLILIVLSAAGFLYRVFNRPTLRIESIRCILDSQSGGYYKYLLTVTGTARGAVNHVLIYTNYSYYDSSVTSSLDCSAWSTCRRISSNQPAKTQFIFKKSYFTQDLVTKSLDLGETISLHDSTKLNPFSGAMVRLDSKVFGDYTCVAAGTPEATFTPPPTPPPPPANNSANNYLLDVNIQPSAEEPRARVTNRWSPGKILCGGGAKKCSENYTSGTDVTLVSALKNPASTSWSGCDITAFDIFCKIKMNSDRSVTLNVIATESSIILLLPNGRKTWIKGQTNIIKWYDTGYYLVGNLEIVLLKCSLSSCTEIGIIASITPGTQASVSEFNWDTKTLSPLPNGGLSQIVDVGKYKILFRSNKVNVSDQSSEAFSIVAAGTSVY